MSWTRLFGASPSLRDMAQYPDTELYGAAAMLRPEERPTVPVKIFDSNTDLTPWGYPVKTNKGKRTHLGAFVPKSKDQIMVNRDGYGYKDRELLSGVLAHEQDHVRPDGNDEISARMKEIAVLSRYGGKKNKLVKAIKKQYGLK